MVLRCAGTIKPDLSLDQLQTDLTISVVHSYKFTEKRHYCRAKASVDSGERKVPCAVDDCVKTFVRFVRYKFSVANDKLKGGVSESEFLESSERVECYLA